MVGTTTMARRVCAALRDVGHEVRHLAEPGEAELAAALSGAVSGVAILLHHDDNALRYALAVAHAAPDVRLVVTIFDATVSVQLRRLLPNAVVTSPAGLAAPTLAAACLDPRLAAISAAGRRAGTAYAIDGGEVRTAEWRRSHVGLRSARSWLASQVMPHDAGSTLLTVGLLGILVILAADWLWLVRAGVPYGTAFEEAVAVVATVGPISHHGEPYAVFAGILMLLTLVLAGMFVAGMVDQLLGPRLVGLIGARALPRSGHVIVVGLGQVGLRLCRHLLGLGVPVVGVERDEGSRYVAIARNLGIPVVVGHGGDRLVMERLRVGHALALAAVGSADLDNIAVAVAARGVDHHARVVIRAGEHEAISETASLLPLGATVDITELGAAYVITHLLGDWAVLVMPRGRDVLVLTDEGEWLTWSASHRDGCVHAA